jgi:hypothetical protein
MCVIHRLVFPFRLAALAALTAVGTRSLMRVKIAGVLPNLGDWVSQVSGPTYQVERLLEQNSESSCADWRRLTGRRGGTLALKVFRVIVQCITTAEEFRY